MSQNSRFDRVSWTIRLEIQRVKQPAGADMGAAERDGTGSGGELASNAASESSPSAAADDGPAFGQRLDDLE